MTAQIPVSALPTRTGRISYRTTLRGSVASSEFDGACEKVDLPKLAVEG